MTTANDILQGGIGGIGELHEPNAKTATDAKSYVPPNKKELSPDDRDALEKALAGYQNYTETLARDRAAIGEPPKVPTLAAPPAQQPPTDPFQAFGQPAMWLAVFGSLATRRPLVNAINAAGGVLKSTQEQNAAAAKQNYETWKVESENAMKMAKFEQDAYAHAINKYRTDAAAGKAEIETLAGAFKNAALLQVYQTEGMPGVIRYLKKASGDAGLLTERQLQVDKLLTEKIDKQAQKDAWLAKNPNADALTRATAMAAIDAGTDPTPKPLSAPETAEREATDKANIAFKAQRGTAYDPQTASDEDRSFWYSLRDQARQQQSAQGARNATLISRSLVSARDAISDIKNVTELPITLSTGIFGGHRQGPGLLDATRNILANKVTAEDAQAYNTAMAGIERALGSLATGGMAVPVSLMEQFGTLKIQEGDTNLIKLRKIATMRQNVENALDVLAANPALGSDQKKQVQELLADIAKAVPWTVHDVQQVEFGRTPNATVREFARQSGVSSGQAAPSGTITQREIDTAPRITNDADGKAAFRALPPGAVFIAPDGKPHRKTAKDQPDGG